MQVLQQLQVLVLLPESVVLRVALGPVQALAVLVQDALLFQQSR